MKSRSLLVVISAFVLANGVIAPSYGNVWQQSQEDNKQQQYTMTELEKIQHTEFSSVAPLQDVAPAQLSDENQKMEHDASSSTVSVQKNPKDGVSVSNKKLGGASVHVGLRMLMGLAMPHLCLRGLSLMIIRTDLRPFPLLRMMAVCKWLLRLIIVMLRPSINTLWGCLRGQN